MSERAVVFDLFHTLVDPEPLYPTGFDKRRAIATIAGVDPAGLVGFWNDTYVERETTTVDLVDLFDRHCTALGRPISTDDRDAIDQVLGVAVDQALREPHPEITRLLDDLGQHTVIGVLSNCHEREVRSWDESPLADHVTVFGRSSRIGAMKPDRRAYDWIAENLGIEPARSVYVGNGGGDELRGARTAGFGSVIHMNAFDRQHTAVTLDEQARRADDADASVDTVADPAATLHHLVDG